jgi:hypothetical protein
VNGIEVKPAADAKILTDLIDHGAEESEQKPALKRRINWPR